MLSQLVLNGCALFREKRPSGETCMASWYGAGFIGRPTASGRRFTKTGRTCAHPSLPFGTILEITNVSNGASTTVTVNDRGPFKRGRCLDLSWQAASDIGLIGPGSGLVSYRITGRDPSYLQTVRYAPEGGPGPYIIQAGSFHELSNALRLKSILEMDYKHVNLGRAADREGKKLYRIYLGDFEDRKDAGHVASRLAAEGYSVLVARKP